MGCGCMGLQGGDVHRLRGAWVDAAAHEAAWREQHRPREHACHRGPEVERLR